MAGTTPRLCSLCHRHPAACVCRDRCVRWGSGPDRCVLALDHLGSCREASGKTADGTGLASVAGVEGETMSYRAVPGLRGE